ncbi:MAG: ATP-dependent DNA helicase RecG [Desulfobacteraceae bacterium]|nr:MAG: ATP-dependent DNA helicase RecG [Desulfobacteraceae bacterium]
MSLNIPYHFEGIPELGVSLISCRGIGPKRAAILAGHGLVTTFDLLFHLPVGYQDRTDFVQIAQLSERTEALVKGRVISWAEEERTRRGRPVFKIKVNDGTGELDLVWFNYRRPHLIGMARKGSLITAYGRLHKRTGRVEMIHPEISKTSPLVDCKPEGIVPVYGSFSGLTSRLIRRWIYSLLEANGKFAADPLPAEMLRETGLPSLFESLRGVHLPDSKKHSFEDFNSGSTSYHRRLQFDRFFFVMLALARKRSPARRGNAPVMKTPADLPERIESALAFNLTFDQKAAIEAIAGDLRSGFQMHRLLEGDVGCGKTAVAAAAACIAVMSGWQVALMVPTQILARQHYEYFMGLVGAMGFRPLLVLGGSSKAQKVSSDLISLGQCNLVIGTHALINESLRFHRLGLVIFDEQHRFGVRQRWELSSKGENPHVLVMTATPIPRTLALILYAEREISIIRELPSARKPVRTVLVRRERRQEVFVALKDALARGEQAIVICPVIDETEDQDLKGAVEMAERLKKLFPPPLKVALIHGRMGVDEKDLIMERFRKGETNLLVGTTVVEVGIHVPGATVMIIEHPERFGLAQLHQLRGRVGRGGLEAVCYLMVSEGLAEAAVRRLEVLEECSDGFEISLKDLKTRGHGELAGVRQAGEGELDIKEMLREPELLKSAKNWAERIISEDPLLERYDHRFLRDIIDGFAK